MMKGGRTPEEERTIPPAAAIRTPATWSASLRSLLSTAVESLIGIIDAKSSSQEIPTFDVKNCCTGSIYGRSLSQMV